jgi:hypothetical protein
MPGAGNVSVDEGIPRTKPEVLATCSCLDPQITKKGPNFMLSTGLLD